MASAAVQLIPAVQTAPQPAPNFTPINANQAQTQPAPEDTVTLTPQAEQGDQAQDQQPQAGQNAAAAPIPQNAVNLDPPIQAALQTGDPAPPAQITVPNQAATSAANLPAVNAAAPNAAGQSVTQEEITAIDAMLEQIGIDPQSYSTAALLAMLPYASSPATLLAYVQELQGTAAQPAANTQNAGVDAQLQAFRATLATVTGNGIASEAAVTAVSITA